MGLSLLVPQLWTHPLNKLFVKCIIYEQHIASVNVTIFKQEKVEVFMENKLVKISWKEMNILHVTLLAKYSQWINGKL
jgi:hypothetical protein